MSGWLSSTFSTFRPSASAGLLAYLGWRLLGLHQALGRRLLCRREGTVPTMGRGSLAYLGLHQALNWRLLGLCQTLDWGLLGLHQTLGWRRLGR